MGQVEVVFCLSKPSQIELRRADIIVCHYLNVPSIDPPAQPDEMFEPGTPFDVRKKPLGILQRVLPVPFVEEHAPTKKISPEGPLQPSGNERQNDQREYRRKGKPKMEDAEYGDSAYQNDGRDIKKLVSSCSVHVSPGNLLFH